jgi:hypothetical protein
VARRVGRSSYMVRVRDGKLRGRCAEARRLRKEKVVA